jgi:IS30 family transposase
MAVFFQEDIMAKNAHLTLSERIIIETCLRDAMSFKQIAR